MQPLGMIFCLGIEAIGRFFIVGIQKHHAETYDRLMSNESTKVAQRTELRYKCIHCIVLIAFRRVGSQT